MATNGYIRACCRDCLFYNDLKYKQECTLYYDDWRADKLQYISWMESEDNKKLFFENCEHQVKLTSLKNTLRQQFGIKMYDYGW